MTDKSLMTFQHRFVELIPDILEQGIIYISVKHDTCIHLCACGCKEEVVTPLDPTDWEFTYNGETISLSPSIGNWDFKCRSHYWIKNSQVVWADQWGEERILANKQFDIQKKEENWHPKGSNQDSPPNKKKGFLDWVRDWFRTDK